jgi:hypothetical protein
MPGAAGRGCLGPCWERCPCGLGGRGFSPGLKAPDGLLVGLFGSKFLVLSVAAGQTGCLQFDIHLFKVISALTSQKYG